MSLAGLENLKPENTMSRMDSDQPPPRIPRHVDAFVKKMNDQEWDRLVAMANAALVEKPRNPIKETR